MIARLIGRRSARSAIAWGYVFALYVFASVSGYQSTYKTAASRTRLQAALAPNVGVRALIGPARHIDTVAGFASWRCLGVLSLVGAAWALLAGTRLLRGEEEAGRWELLLSGPTTRRAAARQGVLGLLAGWTVLFAFTAVAAAADGRAAKPAFTLSASVFFAGALAASAVMFLAVGALASQLAATRRQAASIAGGFLGLAFVLRAVADSTSSLSWLLWLSPLGWVEQLKPLVGSRPVLMLPIAAFVGLVAALAVHLAGARDLNSSVFPDRDSAAPRLRLLAGPSALAVRLVRPVAVGWLSALTLGGLLFGLVAQSAGKATAGVDTVQRALNRLGGSRGGAAVYLGITFLVIATLVAVVACGQAVAIREEEAEGRLDNLLVRPLSRRRWLGGRLAVALSLLVLCGVVAGVGAWVGASSQHSGLGFGRVVGAGLNTVPPAVLLLGLGTLVHAAAPRATAAVTYGLLAWSFLIEFVGAVVKLNHWVLDTSVLFHVAPAPATDPHWVSAAALIGFGVVCALFGNAVLARRDLVSA